MSDKTHKITIHLEADFGIKELLDKTIIDNILALLHLRFDRATIQIDKLTATASAVKRMTGKIDFKA
jgi:hypothetical protein